MINSELSLYDATMLSSIVNAKQVSNERRLLLLSSVSPKAQKIGKYLINNSEILNKEELDIAEFIIECGENE